MSTIVSHKSRWGYHPCSYETFTLIRKLHRYMWRMCRELGRQRAWERKRPENRKGPRPEVCPYIRRLDIEITYSPSQWSRRCRAEAAENFRTGNELILPDRGLIELYRSARYPKSTEVPLWENDSSIRPYLQVLPDLVASIEFWYEL